VVFGHSCYATRGRGYATDLGSDRKVSEEWSGDRTECLLSRGLISLIDFLQEGLKVRPVGSVQCGCFAQRVQSPSIRLLVRSTALCEDHYIHN
jgi:hypothetical protein